MELHWSCRLLRQWTTFPFVSLDRGGSEEHECVLKTLRGRIILAFFHQDVSQDAHDTWKCPKLLILLPLSVNYPTGIRAMLIISLIVMITHHFILYTLLMLAVELNDDLTELLIIKLNIKMDLLFESIWMVAIIVVFKHLYLFKFDQ